MKSNKNKLVNKIIEFQKIEFKKSKFQEIELLKNE